MNESYSNSSKPRRTSRPAHADFEILENSSTRLQIHHMAFALVHVRAGEQPEQMRDRGKIRHLRQSLDECLSKCQPLGGD